MYLILDSDYVFVCVDGCCVPCPYPNVRLKSCWLAKKCIGVVVDLEFECSALQEYLTHLRRARQSAQLAHQLKAEKDKVEKER